MSPALVQRHFGTKEGLRKTCDEHALRSLLGLAGKAAEGAAAKPGFVADMFESGQTASAYLGRALAEGSPAAGSFFDQSAEVTEHFLTSTWPDRFPSGSEHTRETAAVMAAMHNGVLVLHTHVSRRVGADVLAPDQAGRIGAAIGAIYAAMGEYLASGTGAEIRKVTEEYSQSRTKRGNNDG